MQSPTTSNNNNNKAGVNKTAPNKIFNGPKTSSISTKSTTVLNLNKPNGNNKDLETSLEIEKISKKISEHADALYRTWKSHGLAPTEILELYTVDAGVAAGAIADDKSTEDLQKLVNTFVNKDKEQRGVKTSLNKNKLASQNKTETQPKIIEHKINTNSNTTNTSKMATPLTASSGLNNNISLASSQQLNSSLAGIKKSTSSSTSPTKTTNFLMKNTNNLVDSTDTGLANHSTTTAPKVTKLRTSKLGLGGPNLNDNPVLNTSTKQKSTLLTANTTLEQPSKPLEIDIDFNLNLDLNLDVHTLSQQQTENLKKIKELLKDPGSKVTPIQQINANTSKIPAALGGDSTLGGKVKEVKVRKVANKQNEEMPVQRKTNSSEIVQNTKKFGNKIKTTESSAIALQANTNQNTNQVKATVVKTQKSTVKTLKTSKFKEKSNVKETPKDTNDKQTIDSNSPTAAIIAASTLTSNEKISTTASKEPKPKSESEEQAKSNVSDSHHNQNMETQRSNTSTTMPTPTKLKSSRPLTNGQDKSLRSPFLTRGSVAERVLIFEKCPDVRNSFLNIKRPDRADAPPRSLLKVKLHATPPPPPSEQNLIQKELKNTKSVYIPRFYFPHGKPQPTIALERTLRGILSAFDTFPNNQVTKDELPRILKICGLPFYWRMPVMVFCQQHNSGLVERQRFVEFWKQMNVYCHEDASRFVYILSRGQRQRNYILPEDLAPLVQDVVDTHPGLAFLKEATEFHSRYVHTVIARIFYSVNRSWSGKISISELKKSDLLEIITLLEEEDDINQIMAFFSYEHFYVIYCKFWELDKDHDLLINQDDLARHSDHALSTRIVERIFSGCVTRSDNKKTPDDEPKMSYTDFVWFLLSEEDKRTPTAIEYWFRCMDIDGDGLLSMYELEYFYEEQQQRMESIGIESLPFEDCLCQMLDMIKPKRRDAITLGDLKNCKMTHVFFDTFFNLEKYLDHEQRDPFASQRDEYSTDWDRFAAQEYELLITEEN
ncbi:hypothetical protein DOY81_001141 [Sarcophaga bullata]|nr:hypothetical protein DOY81_001141 [Sarcophaga bullata]